MTKTHLASGTYVVAVSGGVDSIVLLDMLAGQAGLELIVAHFDHGIRQDSTEDAEFVRAAAQRYSLPFELGQATLGPGASEEAARTARYSFLRSIAKKYQARIVTAHHADDVIETIAINVARGTGWRGLVSLRD
ncbi:MAG TPA: tRNA lysidine(34) synthetase TilS, partial [Candidatus Saccharimonadales bacterium]